MKTYLNVPYLEKDRAKKLGARWDPEKKRWYAENVENLFAFWDWMPLDKKTTLNTERSKKITTTGTVKGDKKLVRQAKAAKKAKRCAAQAIKDRNSLIEYMAKTTGRHFVPNQLLPGEIPF
jgi:hypothetical protein